MAILKKSEELIEIMHASNVYVENLYDDLIREQRRIRIYLLCLVAIIVFCILFSEYSRSETNNIVIHEEQYTKMENILINAPMEEDFTWTENEKRIMYSVSDSKEHYEIGTCLDALFPYYREDSKSVFQAILYNTCENDSISLYSKMEMQYGEINQNGISVVVTDTKNGDIQVGISFKTLERIKTEKYIMEPTSKTVMRIQTLTPELSSPDTWVIFSVYYESKIHQFYISPPQELSLSKGTGVIGKRRGVLSIQNDAETTSENPNADSNINLSIMALVISLVMSICCCFVFLITSFKTDKNENNKAV